ncbi:FAD-dependent oxidoreductase [Thermoactinospora rubra]|uniref:FAD-dependent oxidoreductase n=1 Tax=Thermoactinospora rubra TaxID=1088767 RepID=UPI001F0A8873|nr:NAD(P)/FAD-dependent oxidoreductase [Thermoactinospora rubra]
MKILIVGAGPAGSLLACHLARRGHRVEVFERRPDPRLAGDDEGRSINLGLSARGVRALTDVGLMDRIRPLAVPMRGRAVHAPDGRVSFHPYGARSDQILHSVRRRDLVTALVEHAAAHPQVTFRFRHRVVDLDRDAPALEAEEEDTGRRLRCTADAVVGADGAFSTVRPSIERDLRREFLPWGYKELTIPSMPVHHEALHVWPGGDDGLIVTHPNRDGSHTATLFLPVERFAQITDPEAFFARRFPDALPLMPYLAKEYGERPVGHLVSVRTRPWRHEGKVVLLGDAAHAVYPFYGQGMNSALEDCTVLDRCLARHADPAAAFAEFERARRPHTDVLEELSRRNFAELRDGVRAPLHRARKRLDLLLARALPGRWVPLYTMISHTTTPYADALAKAERQDAALRRTALGAAGLAVLAAVLAAVFLARKGR